MPPGLQKVFSDIAPSSDLANHVLTLGLDIPWRRKAARLGAGRDLLLRRFQEFRRVLKRGGLFLNLETSQPNSVLVRKLFHGYVKTVVKPVGTLVSGSGAGYIYLSITIPRFYGASALAGLMSEAGFRDVSHKPLMLGAAAIHLARK